MKKLIFSLLPIMVLTLTSCAPPRPAAEAPENKEIPREEREQETKKVSAWEISGAMAAKNNKKAWSASLNWLQDGPSNYQLRLFGPLGSGTVIIRRKGNTITYQDGPKKIHSQNARQLLLEQTGISLPVNNLYYWVRGLAAPGGVQKEKYDRYNHLSLLQQDGYTVYYQRYTSTKGKDLPSKMRLVGHGIAIKLIVKNWKI